MLWYTTIYDVPAKSIWTNLCNKTTTNFTVTATSVTKVTEQPKMVPVQQQTLTMKAIKTNLQGQYFLYNQIMNKKDKVRNGNEKQAYRTGLRSRWPLWNHFRFWFGQSLFIITWIKESFREIWQSIHLKGIIRFS